MALNFGGKCSAFFLILINTVILLFGIGLLVIGIIMRVNAKVLLGTEILKLLNSVGLGGVTLGNLVTSLSIFSICLGCFIIVVAGLGAFGACCKVRFLLLVDIQDYWNSFGTFYIFGLVIRTFKIIWNLIHNIYVIIIILLLLAEIVIVILWATMKNKVESTVKMAMTTVLSQYGGPNATDTISLGWNLLFIGMNCCGVVGPLSNNQEFNNTKWPHGLQLIPYSCCNEATMINYFSGTNEGCQQMYANTYRSTGCYDAIYKWFNQYSTAAMVIAVIILVIEIIAVLFAVVLCRGIKDEEMVV